MHCMRRGSPPPLLPLRKVGSRLRVSARGRRFFTEDGLPGAGVVRLHHFNPLIDGRISKNPGKLLAYRDFLHLQHFLLDTVSQTRSGCGSENCLLVPGGERWSTRFWRTTARPSSRR